LDIQLHANGKPGLRARVERVQSAGSSVKIELSSESGQPVHVELPHERFREETFTVGSDVFVTPRQSHVFVNDYCI
jgi:ABC-type sulfate/molybdate transport systems ATPase subunit